MKGRPMDKIEELRKAGLISGELSKDDQERLERLSEAEVRSLVAILTKANANPAGGRKLHLNFWSGPQPPTV
jgi:hypothetical protein